MAKRKPKAPDWAPEWMRQKKTLSELDRAILDFATISRKRGGTGAGYTEGFQAYGIPGNAKALKHMQPGAWDKAHEKKNQQQDAAAILQSIVPNLDKYAEPEARGLTTPSSADELRQKLIDASAVPPGSVGGFLNFGRAIQREAQNKAARKPTGENPLQEAWGDIVGRPMTVQEMLNRVGGAQAQASRNENTNTRLAAKRFETMRSPWGRVSPEEAARLAKTGQLAREDVIPTDVGTEMLDFGSEKMTNKRFANPFYYLDLAETYLPSRASVKWALNANPPTAADVQNPDAYISRLAAENEKVRLRNAQREIEYGQTAQASGIQNTLGSREGSTRTVDFGAGREEERYSPQLLHYLRLAMEDYPLSEVGNPDYYDVAAKKAANQAVADFATGKRLRDESGRGLSRLTYMDALRGAGAPAAVSSIGGLGLEVFGQLTGVLDFAPGKTAGSNVLRNAAFEGAEELNTATKAANLAKSQVDDMVENVTFFRPASEVDTVRGVRQIRQIEGLSPAGQRSLETAYLNWQKAKAVRDAILKTSDMSGAKTLRQAVEEANSTALDAALRKAAANAERKGKDVQRAVELEGSVFKAPYNVAEIESDVTRRLGDASMMDKPINALDEAEQAIGKRAIGRSAKDYSFLQVRTPFASNASGVALPGSHALSRGLGDVLTLGGRTTGTMDKIRGANFIKDVPFVGSEASRLRNEFGAVKGDVLSEAKRQYLTRGRAARAESQRLEHTNAQRLLGGLNVPKQEQENFLASMGIELDAAEKLRQMRETPFSEVSDLSEARRVKNKVKVRTLKENDLRLIDYTPHVEHMKENGGITINLSTGQREDLTDGFMVSRPSKNTPIDESKITPEFVNSHVYRASKAKGNEGAYGGAWRGNDGKWYFDVSDKVMDRDEAIALGIKNRQKAIWDNATGDEISLAPYYVKGDETKGLNMKHPEAANIKARIDALKKPKTAAPRPVEAQQAGLDFSKFFTGAAKGEYAPEVPWSPVEDMSDVADAVPVYAKNEDGQFSEHIATSIPTFRENQIRKAKAIASVFQGTVAEKLPGRRTRFAKPTTMLDIAGSEGGFGKTVAELSDGRITVDILDPNPQMREVFESGEQVPGVTYIEEGFGMKDDYVDPDTGERIKAWKSKKKYDIVHESMGFQFFSKDRSGDVQRVKAHLNPGGVAFFEEKFIDPDAAENAAREAAKDAYKRTHYTAEQASQKATEVVEGMQDYQARLDKMRAALEKNFGRVEEYWEAGNFRGFIASDSDFAVDEFLEAYGGKRVWDMKSGIGTPVPSKNIGKVMEVKSRIGSKQFPRLTGEPFDAAGYRAAREAPDNPTTLSTGLIYYDDAVSTKPFHDSRYETVRDYYAENKGIRGELVEMSPDEYLERVRAIWGEGFEEQRRPELIAEYAERMRNGEKAPALMLTYSTEPDVGKLDGVDVFRKGSFDEEQSRWVDQWEDVEGNPIPKELEANIVPSDKVNLSQEGIHRALAAKQAGFDKVNVAVITPTEPAAAAPYVAELKPVAIERTTLPAHVKDALYEAGVRDDKTPVYYSELLGQKGSLRELTDKYNSLYPANVGRFVDEKHDIATAAARVYEMMTSGSADEKRAIRNAFSALVRQGHISETVARDAMLGAEIQVDSMRVIAERLGLLDDIIGSNNLEAQRLAREFGWEGNILKGNPATRMTHRAPTPQRHAVNARSAEALLGIEPERGFMGRIKRQPRAAYKSADIQAQEEQFFKTIKERVGAGYETELNPVVASQEDLLQAQLKALNDETRAIMGSSTSRPAYQDASGNWRFFDNGKKVEQDVLSRAQTVGGVKWIPDTRQQGEKLADITTDWGVNQKGNRNEVQQVADAVSQSLIASMTVMRPGFQAINEFGNVWNMLTMGEMSGRQFKNAAQAVFKMITEGGGTTNGVSGTIVLNGVERDLKEVLDGALKNGAASPLEFNPATIYREGKDAGLYNVPFVGKYLELMRTSNSVLENQSRLAIYFANLDQGLDPLTARDIVNKTVYDYELNSLTRGEQWLRQYLPFFTFSRRNLPAQVKLLLTRPYYRNFAQSLMEVLDTEAGSWSENRRESNMEYQNTQGLNLNMNLPEALGGRAVVGFRPPLGDALTTLNALRELSRGRIGSGTAALVGEQINPGIQVAMGTVGNTEEMGANLNTPGGYASYLLGQTPLVGGALSAVRREKKPEAFGGDPNAMERYLFSQLTGIGTRNYDPYYYQTQRNYELGDALAAELAWRKKRKENPLKIEQLEEAGWRVP